MKDEKKIFIIDTAGSSHWLEQYKQILEPLSMDDLYTKDEKFHDTIVFIDNNPDHSRKIKEVLPVNPGINFILYYNDKISPSQLVEFVKSGVIESVSITDQKQIKSLIRQYGTGDGDARLNYHNNLITTFREIGIISNSPVMSEIFAKVEKVANSNSTVLINGENGTGKELIARSIHYFSPRKDYKFVGVNTGAIPENLLEDELFGHIKGSFTNALKDRKGKFEYAHRGTIFLDEISNMPPTLQVKLLRILQEREFERIGENETVPVDVRVVAATNKDIKELVDQEQFREDLYYRLNVIPINLPPLRERRSDIPVLANYFAMKYCRLNNVPPKSFTLPAIRILQNYSWPGNIRQLENIIERMVVLNPDATIFMPKDIPAEVKPDMSNEGTMAIVPDEIPDEGVSLNDVVRNVEKRMILQSLEKTSWNKQKAAKLLNVKRTTLIEKIKKFQD
ncbi:MAG: sigma-54-dependent Fis family transcriptional regulator [bacterium]|nr:sigma-54-dependent Fis family transcriptional regulator [bacterium]